MAALATMLLMSAKQLTELWIAMAAAPSRDEIAALTPAEPLVWP
jgi:hypothetical protein